MNEVKASEEEPMAVSSEYELLLDARIDMLQTKVAALHTEW